MDMTKKNTILSLKISVIFTILIITFNLLSFPMNDIFPYDFFIPLCLGTNFFVISLVSFVICFVTQLATQSVLSKFIKSYDGISFVVGFVLYVLIIFYIYAYHFTKEGGF